MFQMSDTAALRYARPAFRSVSARPIASWTCGLSQSRVVRPRGAAATPDAIHDAEFLFAFVLAGGATLRCNGAHRLAPGDAYVIPAGMPFALDECSGDLALLEVTLPATVTTRAGPDGRG